MELLLQEIGLDDLALLDILALAVKSTQPFSAAATPAAAAPVHRRCVRIGAAAGEAKAATPAGHVAIGPECRVAAALDGELWHIRCEAGRVGAAASSWSSLLLVLLLLVLLVVLLPNKTRACIPERRHAR